MIRRALLAVSILLASLAPAFAGDGGYTSTVPPQWLLTQPNTWTPQQTYTKNNAGTNGAIIVTAAIPFITNIANTQIADNQVWTQGVSGLNYVWQTCTDANSCLTYMSALRSGGSVTSFNLAAQSSVTSSASSAFTVGPAGATSPVLRVDASTASQATGLSILGAATGGTTAVTVIDSGAAASLSINAKTTGTISIAGTSTGATTIGHVLNLPGLATSSAGTTGTLCWTTGTGLVNVDTTTTCLLSLEEYKDILSFGIPKASAEIMQLKPIVFHYKKGTPEYPGDPRVHYGLGAHATESVDRNLVGYTPSGKLRGVRYADSVVALLIASQQEIIRREQERTIAFIATIVGLLLLNLYLFKRTTRTFR